MPPDPEQPEQDAADPAAPTEVAEDDARKLEAPAAPSESGSIDVAVSSGQLPAAPAAVAVASESGSIDVAISGKLPAAADAAPVAPVVDGDSQPITSGAVHAVAARESTGRTKRLTEAAKDAVSGGMTALGSGIGTLGEGVSKLGEKSRKVPLVGSSVSALGESITSVGESLTELPRVAGTRRGRLLVRSLVVGFLLVAVWIVVIVALQLRSGGGTEQIDFRPFAEKVLIELSSGPQVIAQVYEGSSPRFQEFVGKERFIDDMTDLHATVGGFKEIAAVNDTLVTRGPTGRVGRVSLTVVYEKGKTKASVSLHFHENEWKLLGIGVEVPPEVKISQREREERVKACKDPMDPKKCDLYVAANTILEQLRDDEAARVWEAASPIFQKQEEKTRWVQIQRQNQGQLGEFRRIIAVTEQRVFRSGNAVYDILVEYARSQGVRVTFGFNRASKSAPWKLISLKIVVPMPRADEGEPPKSLGASPTGNPPLPVEPSIESPPTTEPAPRPVVRPRRSNGAGNGGSGGAKVTPPDAGSSAVGDGGSKGGATGGGDGTPGTTGSGGGSAGSGGSAGGAKTGSGGSGA